MSTLAGPAGAETQADLAALQQVVEAISAEAEQHWREHEAWPRQAPSFADHNPVELTAAQVRAALGHRLAEHPALDGYIKLQLLSFDPRLSEASGEELKQIVHAMPQVLPQPQPDVAQVRRVASGSAVGGSGRAWIFIGRQRAFVSDVTPIPDAPGFDPTLSVVTEGVSLSVDGTVSPGDPRYVNAVVNTANARILQIRRIHQGVVRPSLMYRNELIERLPRERGVRVYAALRDLQHRLEAGDPSHDESRQRFLAEAAAAGDEPTFTREARQAISAEARQIARIRTEVVDRLEVRRGAEIHADTHTVTMSTEQLKQAMAHLRGS